MNSKKALWIIVLVTLISTVLAGAASAQSGPRPLRNQVELFGTVTQITPTTMTIQDGARTHLILIARAEFETSVGIGDFVKIEATRTASGVWFASEVEDWDPTRPASATVARDTSGGGDDDGRSDDDWNDDDNDDDWDDDDDGSDDDWDDDDGDDD